MIKPFPPSLIAENPKTLRSLFVPKEGHAWKFNKILTPLIDDSKHVSDHVF